MRHLYQVSHAVFFKTMPDAVVGAESADEVARIFRFAS
jgi:hypothetical protein